MKKLKSYLENGETMRQEDLDPKLFLSISVGWGFCGSDASRFRL